MKYDTDGNLKRKPTMRLKQCNKANRRLRRELGQWRAEVNIPRWP
jgi:hypothetical protein